MKTMFNNAKRRDRPVRQAEVKPAALPARDPLAYAAVLKMLG